MSIRPRLCSSAIALFLIVASCGGEAGNQLVSQPQFVLSDTLTIIGADDSRPGHVLHQVRSAVWQPSGHVIIADGSSGEARVYDGEGGLLWTVGRPGAGPGEHRQLTWARIVPGDTVETFDGMTRRFTYWWDGAVAREYQWPHADLTPVVVAGSDAILALRFRRPNSFATGTSHTDSVTIFLVRAGEQPVELTTIPIETRFAASPPTGGVIYTPLPLEPKAAFAGGRTTFYFGYPADGNIRRFDVSGNELAPVGLNYPPQALTSEARSAWQQPIVERMPAEQQPAMRQYLERLPYGELLPIFDALLVDDRERLWVRQFPIPGQASATWRVYEGEREVGTLQLPATERLLHVASDRVVLTATRDDGAEMVIVRLLRWRVAHCFCAGREAVRHALVQRVLNPTAMRKPPLEGTILHANVCGDILSAPGHGLQHHSGTARCSGRRAD
jgi:hypothetical protein